MKLKITLLLFISVLYLKAQVAPTLHHNNLATNIDLVDLADAEIYNNEMYFSLPADGIIIKIDLNVPNVLGTIIASGLSYPTGLAFHNNELYFLQLSDAMQAAGTGKLSKINISQAGQPVTDVVTGLHYPLKLKMNGTNAYIAEAYLNAQQNLTQSEISLINVSGTPSKTILYNNFYSVDDMAIKDNFLYVLEWREDTDNTRILRMDISTGTPVTPEVFYNDNQQSYPYRMAIHGNKIYLNNDSLPAKIRALDITNPALPLADVVSPFTFNGHNTYVGEIAMASGNILYAVGEFVDTFTSTYVLYRADLNPLNVNEFSITEIYPYPNPSSDYIIIPNYQENANYTIYDLQGKLITQGLYNEKIDIRGLNSGMYIIKSDNRQTFKIYKR